MSKVIINLLNEYTNAHPNVTRKFRRNLQQAIKQVGKSDYFNATGKFAQANVHGASAASHTSYAKFLRTHIPTSAKRRKQRSDPKNIKRMNNLINNKINKEHLKAASKYGTYN